MRQEAIELIVALKGHTLPKGAENAYNRFCKAIAEEEKQDVEQSSTESKETFDQPVAWRYALDASVEGPRWIYIDKDPHQWLQGPAMAMAVIEPLYTAPPQREWVGLTDEDEIDWDGGDLKSLVKAIEAKLRSKNQ